MNAMLADSQARNPRPSLQTSRQSQTVETYTERFEAAAIARRGSGNLRKTNSSWARRWWAPVGQVLSHPEKPTRRGHTTVASDTANSLDDHHGECDERKQP